VVPNSQLLTPNSYLGVQTPIEGIPKLGVNFFTASAPVLRKEKSSSEVFKLDKKKTKAH